LYGLRSKEAPEPQASPVNPEEKEEPEETLRVTPAMEAGLTDHIWSLQELVGLLEGKEKEVAA
jgi:hypothetical protein